MKLLSKYIFYGILFLIVGVVSFWASYFFNYFLEITDGLAYSRAYEKISSLDLIDGYENFIIYTGGAEPLSFLIFYFTLRNVVSLEIILGLIIISFYIIPFAIVLKEQ